VRVAFAWGAVPAPAVASLHDQFTEARRVLSCSGLSSLRRDVQTPYGMHFGPYPEYARRAASRLSWSAAPLGLG